jgi:transcriptional regulator with XRE-family HTH domain
MSYHGAMTDAATVLRHARVAAALSQRQVAHAAHVKQPLVSRIERGHQQPSLPTLDRLVKACGYELVVNIAPIPDPHELGLLDAALRLTPEQRVDRLVALHRTVDDLRAAVRAARHRR